MQRLSPKIHHYLPLLLLILVCMVMLITVFTQANDYGITMDEPLQDAYGLSTLHWYTSLGKDTSFLDYPSGLYMPQHGAIFDTLVALVQQVKGDHWYIRVIMTALTGVIGVVTIALCGYEIGGWWLALLAAVGLWLYPRYTGAMWNNPKDIPFATSMIVVLWSVLLLMRYWQSKRYLWYCIFVGCCIGLASSIRVVAVIWFAMLVLLAVGSWIVSGLQARHIGAGMVVVSVSILTMMLAWPYIFLNPFAHLYESIILMSRFPWNGTVFFDGHLYLATQLPHDYVPVWLLIGSPLTLIVCFFLGIAVAVCNGIKKRVVDAQFLVTLLVFLVPVFVLVMLHSVLYNALRQFLFLVPPMVLIASYGVVETVRYLFMYRMKVVAGSMVVALLLSYTLVAIDMANLHPYEYTYFSPIVGGLSGASSRYETDYYNSCDKDAAQWLASHYRDYPHTPQPTVHSITYFEQLVTLYLPSNFHVDEHNPDFLITSGPVRSGYHTIYTVSRQGVTICTVSAMSGDFKE